MWLMRCMCAQWKEVSQVAHWQITGNRTGQAGTGKVAEQVIGSKITRRQQGEYM